MTTTARPTRQSRAEHTRAALLIAAERLFAERGITAVTHRQITDAAGQGNNGAVVYHFGTKEDLVKAIEERHAWAIEELRQRKLATDEPTTLREWVACLVEPLTEHLSALGNPTWYARFAAQVMTDPTYQRIVTKNALQSPTLGRVADGIANSVLHLPDYVRVERTIMTRTMLMHTSAEFERALADHNRLVRPDWQGTAHGLIDAIVALWQASVTPS
jgi:AcrR family transcriptional regulator